MKKFFLYLLVADDFSEDPYGWATNQISHAAIGGMIAWMLQEMGWPIGLGLAVYLAFEIYQMFKGGDQVDSAEDILFFSSGVLWMYVGGSWFLLLATGLFLIGGIAKRVKVLHDPIDYDV